MAKRDSRDIVELALQLHAASTNDEAARILSAEISKFGFSGFVYALMPTIPGGNQVEYLNINTLDPKWMSFYLGQKLYEYDFPAKHCFQAKHPLFWSKMYQEIENGTIRGRWAEVSLVGKEWGVGNGYTIPLLHVGAYNAGISLIADADASVQEQDRLFTAFQPQILALTDTFHAIVDHRSIAAAHYKLSKRQIEVLKWAAEGLLKDAIAYRLNLSVHTVDKHLQKARQRLGAATTTQAVARAVSLGLLYSS